MGKSRIRTEIDIALSHPSTDSYIKSKASVIVRMLKAQPYPENVKEQLLLLEERLVNSNNPFDWHKNLLSYRDLNTIIEIIEELELIFESNN